jgi:REP element-mobilizing transposase RayT
MLYVIENLLEYKSLILSAYSMVPNHFHLVVKNTEKGLKLSDFMRKIQVSYAMYVKKNKDESNR